MINTFLNPYYTVLPNISLNCLSNSFFNNSNFTQYHRFYKYGRDALWSGLKTLDLHKNDEILVPASLCEVVLRAFIKYGLRIQYYSLNSNLLFDISEVESRINQSTRAIYINHFLGRPSPVEQIRKICDKNSLFLIEDCAHAYGGQIGQRNLGTFGDIGIFSYRKFLPIPNGGGLVVNNHSLLMPESLPDNSDFETFKGILKLWILNFASHGFIPLATWKRVRGHINNYLEESDSLALSDWEPPLGISSFSKKLIYNLDLSIIAKKRRENYNFWNEKFACFGRAKPLFPDLETGQVPFSFPLVVENRNDIVRLAAQMGVYLEPTVCSPHRGIISLINGHEPFLEIESISANMLSLPVHQSLEIQNLDYIWSVLMKAMDVSNFSM